MDRLASPVLSRRLLLGVLAALGLPWPARADSPQRWVCTNNDCEPYIYDPRLGDADNIAQPGHPIAPGTPFEALPDTWKCPLCATPKSWFRPTRR
ncbi:rubredoxin [Pararhodospirillum photometricum]|nr:rubredoxin [Pararhodospirillum photometricum]